MDSIYKIFNKVRLSLVITGIVLFIFGIITNQKYLSGLVIGLFMLLPILLVQLFVGVILPHYINKLNQLNHKVFFTVIVIILQLLCSYLFYKLIDWNLLKTQVFNI